MKRTTMLWWIILLLLVGTGAPAAAQAGEEDVLVVRYACFVGGREAGTAPQSSGVLSPRELADFLLEWEPDSDNQEVREVFALNELGELARQAMQLPLRGGQVSGVYLYDGVSYQISMSLSLQKRVDTGEMVAVISAQIRRDHQLLSSPTIQTRLSERAILSTATGPGEPLLFLVVEVDRMTAEELRVRGMKHVWNRDYMLVDGERVQAPKVIEKVQPSYTVEAKQAKQQGRVVLRLVIDAQGRVEDVEVVEGQPYGLNDTAVAAARQWRFEPATHEGRPVPVFYLITFNFRLS